MNASARARLGGALLCAGLLLSGCATVLSPVQRYEARFERALTERDYRTALELIQRAPPADPQHPSSLMEEDELLGMAKRWREELLVEAERYAEEGRWGDGAALLAGADALLPDSLGLSTERSAYGERQQAAATRQLVAFTLLRANNLIAEQAALQPALDAAVKPSPLTVTAARQAADRAQALAVLWPAANTAFDDRQWQRAAQLLEAVVALDPAPSDNLRRKLAYARSQLADVQLREQQHRAERQQQHVDEALRQAGRARVDGDYQRARDILADIHARVGGHEQLTAEQQRLDAAIQDFIAERLEEGDRLYASGEIEAALHQWQRAERLQPGSTEISERILRAQRFIDKYHTLKRE